MIQTQIEIPDLVFEPGAHKYYYKGIHIPNNTSILEEVGLIDLSGIPLERLLYKQNLGTRVHEACHILNENPQDLNFEALTEQERGYVSGYMKFREITGFEPRFSELRLMSKKYGFATTLDEQGPFEWMGRTQESIIELKCVWEVYPSTGPQTAAQELALNELLPEIKNKKRFCLQLKENGHYDIIPLENPKDANTFLSALNVYNWKKENGLLTKE